MRRRRRRKRRRRRRRRHKCVSSSSRSYRHWNLLSLLSIGDRQLFPQGNRNRGDVLRLLTHMSSDEGAYLNRRTIVIVLHINNYFSMYWFLFGEKSNTHTKNTKLFFCFLSFFIFQNKAILLSWGANKQQSHVEDGGRSTGEVYHGGQDKG